MSQVEIPVLSSSQFAKAIQEIVDESKGTITHLEAVQDFLEMNEEVEPETIASLIQRNQKCQLVNLSTCQQAMSQPKKVVGQAFSLTTLTVLSSIKRMMCNHRTSQLDLHDFWWEKLCQTRANKGGPPRMASAAILDTLTLVFLILYQITQQSITALRHLVKISPDKNTTTYNTC